MLKIFVREVQYNSRLFLIVYLLTVPLIIFAFLILGSAVLRDSANLSTILRSNSRYSAVINYDIGIDNTYIYDDSSIVFYNNQNIQNNTAGISSYNVMEMNTHYDNRDDIFNSIILGGTYTKLDKNEIAISKNIAVKYSLKVGDELFADIGYTSNVQSYQIKYIFGYTHNLLDTDFSLNKGTILMGYDEAYELNMANKYLVFDEENFSNLYMNNPGLLDQEIFIKQSINFLYFRIVFNIFILTTFLVMFTIPIWKLQFYKNIKKYRKLFLMGYEYIEVRKIIKLDILLFYLIPFVLAIAIYSIIISSFYIFYVYYFAILFLLISYAVTIMIYYYVIGKLIKQRGYCNVNSKN